MAISCQSLGILYTQNGHSLRTNGRSLSSSFATHRNSHHILTEQNPSRKCGLSNKMTYLCTQETKQQRNMATSIQFDRQKFIESLRAYRVQKRQWQERINKELDAREAEIQRTHQLFHEVISLFDSQIALFQENKQYPLTLLSRDILPLYLVQQEGVL